MKTFYISLLLFFVLISTKANSQILELENPFKLDYLTDYFIIGYPNHGDSLNPLDYLGRNKANGSLMSTQYFISSRKGFTEGVYLYAVADGTVEYAIDTNLNKYQFDPFPNNPNSLIVRNGDYTFEYSNLVVNSLLVKIGDKIEAGAKIAKYIKSDTCPLANLDLTVKYKGETIDPFIGIKDPNPQITWKEQLNYDSLKRMTTYGLCAYPEQSIHWKDKEDTLIGRIKRIRNSNFGLDLVMTNCSQKDSIGYKIIDSKGILQRYEVMNLIGYTTLYISFGNYSADMLDIYRICCFSGKIEFICDEFEIYDKVESVEENLQSSEGINITPNPVTDFLNINTNIFSEKIEIYSSQGILMIETKVTDNIDVSRLNTGLYFIKSGNRVAKFVKM